MINYLWLSSEFSSGQTIVSIDKLYYLVEIVMYDVTLLFNKYHIHESLLLGCIAFLL